MSTKTYIATKFLDLTTEVMVDGKIKTIRLKGGIMSPRRINGSYTTNDPKIQEAIEAAPGFNKRFKLHRDWGEAEKTVDAPKKVITPEITGPHNATEEVTITGPTPETSPEAVVKEDPVPDPVVEKEPEPTPEHSVYENVKEEAAVASKPTPIVDENVTSGNKAKAFLFDHFDDVTSSMVRNNAMIRDLAESRNVSFPNWPK